MRIALIGLCLGTPALAWEASFESPVCLLTHATADADVLISHDPRKDAPYTIQLTRQGGWDNGPTFSIRFEGPGQRTISTGNHQLEGDTLAVTDTGFGNVLDGIAFNQSAIAMTDETAVVLPLADAAMAVERFRACTDALGV